MISTGNIPIKVLGEPVTLTYEAPGGVAADGISYADDQRTVLPARALVTPGVPENLRPEVAGERWDDYFTFYVDASVVTAVNGADVRLLDIERSGVSYKVTTIRDWGSSFMCIGERQR